MTALGPYLAACALLVFAGGAKAARPGDSAKALTAMIPRLAGSSSAIVRCLAVAEGLLGLVSLALVGPVTAGMVALSYASFAGVVLAVRLRGGVLATCGCFGGTDTPPTISHAVVDAGAAAAAGMVAIWAGSSWTPELLGRQPWHGVPLVLGSAAVGLLAFAVMSPLARLQAVRSELPAAPMASEAGT